MSLARLANNERLLVCVGSGGVGKTTVSAALGVSVAEQGKRVLLLTADPAKRLADALGLDGLDDSPKRVQLQVANHGELWAAMLDTKRSFDDLIRRVTDEPASAARILANPTYDAFSRTLARSHAYATSERLHEALADKRWDVVVLDTPPAQSAVEILDAPARLARFLDGRVARWFLQSVARAGERGQGGGAIRRLLSTLAGGSVTSTLFEFLSEMAFLHEGFRERTRSLRDALRSEHTGFVLITSATASQLAMARRVHHDLESRRLSVSAVVFNRGFESEPHSFDQPIAPLPQTMPSSEYDRLAGKLAEIRRNAVSENEKRTRHMKKFMEQLDARPTVLRLAEVYTRLADLEVLSAWARAALPVA